MPARQPAPSPSLSAAALPAATEPASVSATVALRLRHIIALIAVDPGLSIAERAELGCSLKRIAEDVELRQPAPHSLAEAVHVLSRNYRATFHQREETPWMRDFLRLDHMLEIYRLGS